MFVYIVEMSKLYGVLLLFLKQKIKEWRPVKWSDDHINKLNDFYIQNINYYPCIYLALYYQLIDKFKIISFSAVCIVYKNIPTCKVRVL